MFKLIKNERVVVDGWKTLTLAEGETPHSVRLPAGPVLVPLSVWRARRAELVHSEYEHGWPLGIWLSAEESMEDIERDIDDFSVVVIRSEAADKNHSIACMLRERYGYKGELHAAAIA